MHAPEKQKREKWLRAQHMWVDGGYESAQEAKGTQKGTRVRRRTHFTEGLEMCSEVEFPCSNKGGCM